MNEVFEAACRYLIDSRHLLVAVVPVLPLANLIDGYCRSELLFENAVMAATRSPENLRPIVALIHTCSIEAVQTWARSVQHSIEPPGVEYIIGYVSNQEKLLHTALKWVVTAVCLRPRCYYRGYPVYGRHCHCGWPILLLWY